MGQDSTNLDFYLPDIGEDGYGDEKNSDWQDLDTRLKNLPADGTHDNAAHSTDYAATGHTHPASDLEQSSATNGQHLAWDGSAWVPVDPPSDTDTNTQAYSTAASGSVSLNGSETVDIDTGVAVNAKFYVPECNPPPDCDYAVSVFRDDSGTGNWVIRFEQNDTALTSGTVNWRLKEDVQ
jgi:hypothetical protein